LTPDQARMMATVEYHLNAGRPHEAQDVLVRVASQIPEEPRLWWAQATLAQMAGDTATVERALRKVAELDKDNPQAPAALGDFLIENGRTDDAVAAWREAHNRDPRFMGGTVSLAQHLTATGDAAGAIALLDKSLKGRPDPTFLTLRAVAHAQLGDTVAELKDHEASVVASGSDPTALRNLAMALGAHGRLEEAEGVLRKAMARQPGSGALVHALAHTFQARDRFDEAQATLEDAVRLDPANPAIHRDLAELVWMRTGHVGAASVRLDEVLPGLSEAERQPLLVVKAKLHEYAGDLDAARDILVPAADKPGAPNYVLCAASQVLLPVDPLKAAILAAQAIAKAPNDTFGLATLAQAQLAAGDVDGAAATAEKIRKLDPNDQHGVALLATAWRLKGDERYRQLYDYDAFVSANLIETPVGWDSLDAYLADLKAALERLHGLKAHPIGQTLRGGTQTNVQLEQSDDPAIKAFFKAIDAPIRAYIARLGQGDDAMRGRPHGEGYRISGSWSVRLAPGGHHVDHLHHSGWISSAFYVDLPASVRAEGDEGSLRFGQPGTDTKPAVEAEFRVKPQPGLLVLFPSYMWHGTESFGGDKPRLTIAFDVVPA
jgi:predicted Zn-dependent protease